MKKKIILLLSIISFGSCGDCEQSAQSYKKDNLEVILTERPVIQGEMKIVGKK